MTEKTRAEFQSDVASALPTGGRNTALSVTEQFVHLSDSVVFLDEMPEASSGGPTFDGVEVTDVAAGSNVTFSYDGDGTITLNVDASVTLGDGDYGDVIVSASGTAMAVTEVAVTQHQGALALTESQIIDLGGYALDGHTHTLADISDAGTAAGSDIAAFATSEQGDKADTAVQPETIYDYGLVKSDTSQAGGGTAVINLVAITDAAYSAIGTPDADTLYFITG